MRQHKGKLNLCGLTGLIVVCDKLSSNIVLVYFETLSFRRPIAVNKLTNPWTRTASGWCAFCTVIPRAFVANHTLATDATRTRSAAASVDVTVSIDLTVLAKNKFVL